MYYILESVNSTDVVTEIKVPTLEQYNEICSWEPTEITSNYEDFVARYVEREQKQQLFVNQKPRKIINIVVSSKDDPVIKLTEQKEGFVKWLGL
jgi:hypothetical protein